MAEIECKICGGWLKLPAGVTLGECPHCGTLTTFPKITDEQQEQLYNRAEQFRRSGDFDKAVSCYEDLIWQMPEDAEAYWGLVLSRCGVEYIEDPVSHKRVPACHRLLPEPIFSDPDYCRVLELATEDTRPLYEQQAAQIAEFQKFSSQETSQKAAAAPADKPEPPAARKTPVTPSVEFPSFSIETDNPLLVRVQLFLESGDFASARQYCERILDEDPKNAYAYFYRLMAEREISEARKLLQVRKLAEDKSFVLARRFADPELAKKLDDILRIQDIAEKEAASAANPDRGTQDVPEMDSSSEDPQISAWLKRVKIFLEDEAWSSAIQYCEKILDKNPEYASAYVYKCLAKHQIRRLEDLMDTSAHQSVRFESMIDKIVHDPDFWHAHQFADRELRAKLQKILALAPETVAKKEIDCTMKLPFEAKVWGVGASLLLPLFTFGLWSVFLVYQWAANINFLLKKKRLVPAALTGVFFLSLVFSYIPDFCGWEIVCIIGSLINSGILFYMVYTLFVESRNAGEAPPKISSEINFLIWLFVAEFFLSLTTLHQCGPECEDGCSVLFFGFLYFTVKLGVFAVIQSIINSYLVKTHGQAYLSQVSKRHLRAVLIIGGGLFAVIVLIWLVAGGVVRSRFVKAPIIKLLLVILGAGIVALFPSLKEKSSNKKEK